MATVIKIPPGGLAVQFRATARAGLAGLKRAVRRASQRGAGLLKTLTPVDEGVARAAWSAKTYSSGWTGIENSAPHIGILLKGARPHAVNVEGVEAIREWVIRKGLIRINVPLRKGHHGPQRQRNLTRSEAQGEMSWAVDEIVWAIINKLKKYGYKGDDFVTRSMPELVAYLDTEAAVELEKAITKPKESQ